MPLPEQKRAWLLAVLDEFEPRLVRYALRLLGDDASARDAVQHAFLRLCDEPAEQSERSNPAAWLFTVVRNRAVDLLRERGRTQLLDDVAQVGGVDDDPALMLERDDLLAVVRRLLETLPTAQGEAIGLWSEGFSYAEMAGITGRGEGNLRVLVHRAIASLKQHPAVRSASEEWESETAKPGRPESIT